MMYQMIFSDEEQGSLFLPDTPQIQALGGAHHQN
jgi:hypothetical protein